MLKTGSKLVFFFTKITLPYGLFRNDLILKMKKKMDLKKKQQKKPQQFLIINEQKILSDLIKFTHFPLEFEKASLFITLKLGSARSHNFIGQHCYCMGESFQDYS